MEKTIRVLTSKDFPYLKEMNTGIEDDYVIRIFDRLSTEPNRLYGLFIEDQLVSLGGISIYMNRYAMLGRLRSDRRYRGNDFATKLMAFMMNEAFQIEGIQWVGANTQEENIPARRVMDKIGLSAYTMTHGALTEDTSILQTGGKLWTPIHNLERKKEWVDKVYVQQAAVFPFECYYPFPASEALFSVENLLEWSFYENEDKTRFLITKPDQKKYRYLHAVYPWNDKTEQPGLWETISADYQDLVQQTADDNEVETYIWMDLTKEEVELLPANHPFTLPSPWILYGITKQEWQKTKETVAVEK
ncbi:GNAT family N-acetyltransferase [Ornithinibacillus sp. L9]|uniref:GNAT family N-acetyltransferase n=1 Tax=Ornithinibacillus caprae TaxID=2678566 RepID=A0A6N8FEG4_9BACI|nr:GNAT family N-acetyltransferase [Ornithinibacillus caprae]MUK87930.1 GNAT family N-acetyltransferase [Ornithinibacillus caprae]